MISPAIPPALQRISPNSRPIKKVTSPTSSPCPKMCHSPKPRLEPHIAYFVVLLRRSAVRGEPLDEALVAGTRETLQRVGVTSRYYDRYVNVLADERFDPNGPATPENLKYPPVTLAR
jgi:hypothetical protein